MRMGTGFLISLFASAVVWMISDHIGLGTLVRLGIMGVILLVGSLIGSGQGRRKISGAFGKLKLGKSKSADPDETVETIVESEDGKCQLTAVLTSTQTKALRGVVKDQASWLKDRADANFEKIRKIKLQDEIERERRIRRGPLVLLFTGLLVCSHIYGAIVLLAWLGKDIELIGANGLTSWFSADSNGVEEVTLFDDTLEPRQSHFVKYAAGDTIRTESEEPIVMRINNPDTNGPTPAWFGIPKEDSRIMEKDGSLLIMNNRKDAVDVVIKKIPKPVIVAKEEPKPEAKKTEEKTKKGEKPKKSFWSRVTGGDEEGSAKPEPKKEEPGLFEKIEAAKTLGIIPK
jgi:hypothetical protein